MTVGKLLSGLGVKFRHGLLAGLLFACPSFAQNITGTILGTVTDASGAAVTGASLVIVDQNTNIEHKAVSDAGEYTVTNLPPGQPIRSGPNSAVSNQASQRILCCWLTVPRASILSSLPAL